MLSAHRIHFGWMAFAVIRVVASGVTAIMIMSCDKASDESATRTISGKVVDASGNPMPRVRVMAITFGRRIHDFAGSEGIVGETRSAHDGTFAIPVGHYIRVKVVGDELAQDVIQYLKAESNDFHFSGELRDVKESGNVIRVFSLVRPPPSPHQ